MRDVVKRSKSLSNSMYPGIKGRVRRMGMKKEDAKRLLRYIRDEAPIIIHVALENLIDFFLNDTHYRNQFETCTSRGALSVSLRKKWEKRMFHNKYKNATPFERVKYGVLNMVNDPLGIQSCWGYGTSFFILKKVRLRTSFADRDSSDYFSRIACCEHYCHVLNRYNDREFADILDVSKNIQHDRKYGKSSAGHGWKYKEIQIHGEIRFDTNIAAIRVENAHRHNTSLLNKIKEFAAKNNITDVTLQDGTPL